MLTAGEALNAGEAAQLTQLITAVMTHYADWSANDHQEGERRVSFLQTGSTWLRDLAVNNTSNWRCIDTDNIRNTMAFSRDDPITYGNCVHVLCLLCSEEKTSRMIWENTGIDEIIDYLPIQFPGNRGEANPSHTFTLYNKNLLFMLLTLRHLTELYDDYLHVSRTNRRSNLEKVLDTLHSWMSDETSQGLTLQVLHNLIRERDIMSKPIQQHSSTDPDTGTDVETPEEVKNDRTMPRAQDVLYRLEIESHKIEQLTRTLQNNPSQHHVTQGLGRKILQVLSPRGFSLDIRTPEVQELRWSHQISGAYFGTLPDLEEVAIILSYWHCLKGTWHSQAGTIPVPSSGNIIKLSQMLLWNHPSMTMQSFSQGISETRGLHEAIPLTTTILTLGHKVLGTRLHLTLPDWESGHQDLHPRHNHRTEHKAKQILGSKLLPSAWLHDGGEALGNLGIKILGGYKLAPYTGTRELKP